MSKVILFFPKLESQTVLLPASVLYIAAPLIQAGHEVRIIDQRVEPRWKEVLLEELKANPLAVGISAKTGKQIFYGLQAAKIVRENSPTKIIWGGVHPTLLPEQTLRSAYVDFIVIGEGELAFLNLIKKLVAKETYQDLLGVGFKDGDRVVCNPTKEFIDLDNLSPLPYHLIDVEKYITKRSYATGKKARNVAFYTSRGCPHRCTFCYNKEFNKQRFRGESAEGVVEKIKQLVRDYKITALEIEDDEFFANPERARGIAELLINQRLEIEIFTTCRINYVARLMDDDYLNLVRRAGFKSLAFGVESGSPRIQQMIDKDITNDQVIETIKRLKKADIGSKYYFMVGFPTETIEDIYATTDLIKKMKEIDHDIRIPAWRIYTPYPGTELYRLSLEYGFKPPQSLEEWAEFDFNTVKTPWIDSNRQKIIRNVAFLNKFINLQSKDLKGFYGRLIKIYGQIADYRWENHLFSFVPERYLIEIVSWLKHYLTPKS